jgi:hypothetical protein
MLNQVREAAREPGRSGRNRQEHSGDSRLRGLRQLDHGGDHTVRSGGVLPRVCAAQLSLGQWAVQDIFHRGMSDQSYEATHWVWRS